MLTIKQYVLPTYRQGVLAIETTRNELINRYRSGQKLDIEELDWLDWAEIALDTRRKINFRR